MRSEACSCGSGLTAGACCGYNEAGPPRCDNVRLALAEQEAVLAWGQGDRRKGVRLCVEILEVAPRNTVALRILAEARQAEGVCNAYCVLLRRIIEINPNDLWATQKLCVVELSRPDLATAELHARNSVRIAPENAQSHNLMGMVMTEARRPAVGEYHYREAIRLSGARNPLVLANLGLNLKNQGRIDEARSLYQESVEKAPNVARTFVGWAQLEEIDRKFDAAHALLDRAMALSPRDASATLSRAVLLGREGKYESAVGLIEKAASDEARSLSPPEHLERGRLFDRLGRYDEAWADFEKGKATAREMSGHAYLDTEVSERIQKLKQFFTRSRTAILPRATVNQDVPQPIFILGFPRSGTTLLEQTLSAMPDISAGDELPLVHDLTEVMPRLLASPLGYPEALSELWMGDQREGLDVLRDHYLQKVHQMGVIRPGARLFTDKMPLNEVHLGLIALVFPAAPLLHMVRHPLDVMVSAMSNFYSHGAFCSTALVTAAKHLLRVYDLVEYYRGEMDLNYFRVRYEDIVDDQEKTIRDVFEFLNITFDSQVLKFEKNRRYARTASYAQVTEKLYDRSRYRYCQYLQHLAPAVQILEPVIKRLGYVI